jgi:hypothetical protein
LGVGIFGNHKNWPKNSKYCRHDEERKNPEKRTSGLRSVSFLAFAESGKDLGFWVLGFGFGFRF